MTSLATHEATTPPRRRRATRQTSTRRLGLALAAPALVYIVVFLAFPLVYNLYLSVTDAQGANLISGDLPFVGTENYAAVLGDSNFWHAATLSLVFTVACLVLQYAFGFALALFFRKPFPGNGPIRALLLVGWILPPVVTATVFRWMFDSDYGVLNHVLVTVGLINEPVQWLSQGATAMTAVIIANLWVGIPFNMLLLLSGLHLIDETLYEAAAVDGASPWRQFRSITFPLMRPVSISVLLLGVINTYKVFDLIYTMTRGGPVDSTTTLPIYTYLETFSFFQFGTGAAASALTLILPLTLSYFYVKSLTQEDR